MQATYMLTDLIHLLSGEAIVWFDLVLILSFGFNGLLFYCLTVNDMTEVTIQLGAPIWLRSAFFFLPVLISIGVYIGRFRRWNSWDLLTEPTGPIRDVFSLIRYPAQHSFDWLFIVGFSLVLYMSNVGFKRLGFLNKLD